MLEKPQRNRFLTPLARLAARLPGGVGGVELLLPAAGTPASTIEYTDLMTRTRLGNVAEVTMVERDLTGHTQDRSRRS